MSAVLTVKLKPIVKICIAMTKHKLMQYKHIWKDRGIPNFLKSEMFNVACSNLWL